MHSNDKFIFESLELKENIMEKYVAAIDQGTTSTKFILFDKRGYPVKSAYEWHKQIYPSPGYVEHDALEIWNKTKDAIRKVMNKDRIDPKEIDSIGITNQRETVVIWDPRDGRPLCNAIVWQCTRTRCLCEDLSARGMEELVSKKTGLKINTYFSGPKIKWLLDNIPKINEKARKGEAFFGNIDSWLIWNLTGGPEGGVHITDFTNASRTMLMDIKKLEWDEELLDEFGIPIEMLPEIRPSSAKNFYGYTSKDGPFGLEIPICGDIGDQQAALFGQTCFEVGEAKNTYGTGSFLLQNTGSTPVKSKNGLISTVAYGLDEKKAIYALEGSIAITGAAIQWLKNNLGLIRIAAETETIARSVEDSGGVYFVPAFVGLFTPYWDMDARGTIIGLTQNTKREHIVRATLESICYQTKDVIEAMRRDYGIRLKTLKVDGGASKNNFLMQLQSDILGIPCVRPSIMEATALGSAYCAGLASGFWSGLDEIKKIWAIDKTFEPKWPEDRRETGYRDWTRAVKRALKWIE